MSSSRSVLEKWDKLHGAWDFGLHRCLTLRCLTLHSLGLGSRQEIPKPGSLSFKDPKPETLEPSILNSFFRDRELLKLQDARRRNYMLNTSSSGKVMMHDADPDYQEPSLEEP